MLIRVSGGLTLALDHGSKFDHTRVVDVVTDYSSVRAEQKCSQGKVETRVAFGERDMHGLVSLARTAYWLYHVGIERSYDRRRGDDPVT